jgi:hypothetical protein
VTTASPDIVDLTGLDHDWDVPCDFYGNFACCKGEAAAWIAHRVVCPSCGKGGNPRLICTRCKDSLMYGDEVITCGRSRGCEYVYDPPRLILSYVEPLKKGAA